MFNARTATAVAVLVLTFGLSAVVGCGRSQKTASPAAEHQQQAAVPTPLTQAATGQAQEGDQLAAREQALTEREAALDAREAELARQQRQPVVRATSAASPPAPAAPPAQPAVPAVPTPVPPTPTPAPIPVTVPAGALVTVEFQQKLSSHESAEGQEFTARVAEPVRVAQGIAIPAGSVVSGRVTEAKPAKKIGGSATLAVEFVSVRLPSGETTPFRATFSSKGKSSTGKDVAIIAGAAAGGAILGNQVFHDNGSAKGALIGAAAGAIAASQTKAKPVVIEAGTLTNLELTEPINLTIRP